jgi:hypothetical protein
MHAIRRRLDAFVNRPDAEQSPGVNLLLIPLTLAGLSFGLGCLLAGNALAFIALPIGAGAGICFWLRMNAP